MARLFGEIYPMVKKIGQLARERSYQYDPPPPERVAHPAKGVPVSGSVPANHKICPFMSSAGSEVLCNAKCALYRPKKEAGYNCPIGELDSMSYIMRGKPQKKINL